MNATLSPLFARALFALAITVGNVGIACSPVPTPRLNCPDSPEDPSLDEARVVIEERGIVALDPNSARSAATPFLISTELANCGPVQTEWAHTASVWLRAAALINREYPRSFGAPPNTPYVRLRDALADPTPALRAAALMVIDISDPAGRAEVEAALNDGAWVQPVAATVADHAYQRLSEVLDSQALLALRRDPIGRLKLNAFRGATQVSRLRSPWIDRAPDWQQALTSEVSYVPDAVLAGLWHGAQTATLIEYLSDPRGMVALTAFDALTEGRGAMQAAKAASFVARGRGLVSTNFEPCNFDGEYAGTAALRAALEVSNDEQVDGFLQALEPQYVLYRQEVEAEGQQYWQAQAEQCHQSQPPKRADDDIEVLCTVTMRITGEWERSQRKQIAELLGELSKRGVPTGSGP